MNKSNEKKKKKIKLSKKSRWRINSFTVKIVKKEEEKEML